MPRLENYCFFTCDIETGEVSGLISLNDSKDLELNNVVVNGTIYGKVDFSDGDIITTSRITDLKEKIVTTTDEVYELGNKHPDYIAFEEAVTKKIPIIKNWEIGNMPNGRMYVRGIVDGKEFAKMVVSQNFYDHTIKTFDNLEYFVDWTNCVPFQKKSIERRIESSKMMGINSGIKGKEFLEHFTEYDLLNSCWTTCAAARYLTDKMAYKQGVISQIYKSSI